MLHRFLHTISYIRGYSSLTNLKRDQVWKKNLQLITRCWGIMIFSLYKHVLPMDPKKKIVCGPWFLCIPPLEVCSQSHPGHSHRTRPPCQRRAPRLLLTRNPSRVTGACPSGPVAHSPRHRGMWRRSIEEIHVILQSEHFKARGLLKRHQTLGLSQKWGKGPFYGNWKMRKWCSVLGN